MIKALITAEGSARKINPEMDIISESRDEVTRIAKRTLSPDALFKEGYRFFNQIFNFQKSIPDRLGKIIDKLEKGRLNVRFVHENLGGLIESLENAFNRLSVAVIIAALIIGSSLIITTGVGPLIMGFPALGIIGYLISGIFGIWLILAIMRNSKY